MESVFRDSIVKVGRRSDVYSARSKRQIQDSEAHGHRSNKASIASEKANLAVGHLSLGLGKLDSKNAD